MKRPKTTNKLTEAERRELIYKVNEWAAARGKPVTKAERKMRWQQLVFAKIKAEARSRQRHKSSSPANTTTRRDGGQAETQAQERRKEPYG